MKTMRKLYSQKRIILTIVIILILGLFISYRLYFKSHKLITKVDSVHSTHNNTKSETLIQSELQRLSFDLKEVSYRKNELNKTKFESINNLPDNLENLIGSSLQGVFQTVFKLPEKAEHIKLFERPQRFFNKNFKPRNNISEYLGNNFCITFSSNKDIAFYTLYKRIQKSTTLKTIISEGRVLDMGILKLGVLTDSSIKDLNAQYPYIVYKEANKTKILTRR